MSRVCKRIGAVVAELNVTREQIKEAIDKKVINVDPKVNGGYFYPKHIEALRAYFSSQAEVASHLDDKVIHQELVTEPSSIRTDDVYAIDELDQITNKLDSYKPLFEKVSELQALEVSTKRVKAEIKQMAKELQLV
jgi:hypothetical protein